MIKKVIRRSYGLRNKILLSFAVAIAILAVLLSMIYSVYLQSAKSCYDELDSITSKLKVDIYMQMQSDTYQMKTIANFAASIYENQEIRRFIETLDTKGIDGKEDFSVIQDELAVVFNSFQKSGLIDELEILLPGDVIITTSGTYDVSKYISFEDAAAKGAYISDVRNSFIHESQKVIHSAVPIVSNSKTIAVLMGVMDINRLADSYRGFIHNDHAHLHLVSGNTGNYIINTAHNHHHGISDIEIVKSNNADFVKSMKKGEKGNVAYKTKDGDEFIFASYDSVGVNDWRVIVAMPENEAFAEGRKTMFAMISLALIIAVIMVIYILFFFMDERRKINLTTTASTVRKLLLEFGQLHEGLNEAFRLIVNSTKSRSAFFVDTDGEWYDYIRNDFSNVDFSPEKRKDFMHCLQKYTEEHKHEIFVKEIKFTEELKNTDPKLYEIMKERGIFNVVYTTIWNKSNHASTLGVSNCRKVPHTIALLCDIAMCFGITIYNSKHLDETELAAVTDSLTGLTNRMGFNRDVAKLQNKNCESMACVYIDVNELHSYNNKYGHLAGDKMLCTIAEIISKEFSGFRVYRWGGDEFIVFADNTPEEKLIGMVSAIKTKANDAGFHISVGYSFASGRPELELLLQEAEKRMYEAKAKYYQNKANNHTNAIRVTKDVSHVNTGNAEVDALLSIVGERYLGVYSVSLSNDSGKGILVTDKKRDSIDESVIFTNGLKEYASSKVNPDDNRAFSTFVNYDVIRAELSKGITPTITYKKLDGDQVTLRVYKLEEKGEFETLWVFEKNN